MNTAYAEKKAFLKQFFHEPNSLLMIAGPCSAETEDQVISTAQQINEHNTIHLMRAGIWKPRTRPSDFEGVGAVGLEWLKNAKHLTGIPTTVEVATAKHVEVALKNEVDVLWIGARTTVNPFSVQEIANALKGVDVPVMIKNPVNPDIQLWIGALERIQRAGIKEIAVIHRGFSSYKKSSFRNDPTWQIPIEFKSLFPTIPMICDPSHICGNRQLLGYIAQRAIDLDMNGLMIESHINPSKALTDAKQQLTPTALKELLSQLVLRTREAHSSEFETKIEEYRKKIDHIDDEILERVAQRMKVADEIGVFKKEYQVTALQIKRWEEMLEQRSQLSNTLHLSKEFIKQMLELLHREAIQRQLEIMNNAKNEKK